MSLAVWHERLLTIADVMLADCPTATAAALLGKDGRVVALAGDAAFSFGAIGFAARALIAALPLEAGQSAFTNDSACGGTCLSQLLWLAPAHVDDVLIGYVAIIARHASLGGSTRVGYTAAPGALPEVEERPPAVGPRYESASVVHNVVAEPLASIDEGELVRPTKWSANALAAIAGDHAQFNAQRSAAEKGATALAKLAGTHGASALIAASVALVQASADHARGLVTKIPPGVYAFADSLDDGAANGHPVVIRLTLTVSADTIVFDFTDSDPATRGCTNATIATTLAACAAVMRQLVPDAPLNDGILSVIDFRVRPGSVVAAPESAAVWGGAFETLRRIIDVTLGAFAQALPTLIPAASAGSASYLAIESATTSLAVALAGGAGASPTENGDAALDRDFRAHSTEAIEASNVVRIVHQTMRRESGGGGVQHGGDGIARELVFITDATLTLLGDRRTQPPYGLRGGGPGLTARDSLVRGDRRVTLPSKIRFGVQKGDRLLTLTPGGAGDGDPIRAKFWNSILTGEPLVL